MCMPEKFLTFSVLYFLVSALGSSNKESVSGPVSYLSDNSCRPIRKDNLDEPEQEQTCVTVIGAPVPAVRHRKSGPNNRSRRVSNINLSLCKSIQIIHPRVF